ncbi:MAG: OmpA family protein [bacterium]|jgi:outer membrane protein OmpA-like peptidoglycan-associated protein|nr:OmpA family protein [Betaproteobacteria bacterium]
MIRHPATPTHPAGANRFRMTAIALALLAGCATVPADNAMLDAARSSYRSVQDDPDARQFAATELDQASLALKEADAAWARDEDKDRIDHLAYLARQRAAIAQETTRRRTAERAAGNAGAARNELRLEARTVEAERFQRSAESATRDADEARRESDAAARRAAGATADAQAARRATEAARLKTAAAQLEAGAVQARNDQLAAKLAALDAKQTDRGMVVSIGDVLFDTNRSELRDAGLRSVDKLVAFMKQYPQRTALIEGFTDSTGSNAINGPLSGRRAEAVRAAMVSGGISAGRLQAMGLGETQPVGSNDTAAGRQSNRRVEVIISENGGVVAPR